MEQTPLIKKSIEEGQKKVETEEAELLAKKYKREEEAKASWGKLFEKAKDNIPILADGLKFDVDISGQSAPPNLSWVCASIEIEGLAPIYLYFDEEDRIKEYLVPAVGWNDEDDVYYWNKGGNTDYWLLGSKKISSLDLSLVMFHAKRNFEIFQTAEHELEYRRRERDQLAKDKHSEPVYEKLPENADQAVVIGIRQIIRDEIHKMAYDE